MKQKIYMIAEKDGLKYNYLGGVGVFTSIENAEKTIKSLKKNFNNDLIIVDMDIDGEF